MSSAWGFLAHPAFSVFDAVVRARLSALTRFPAPSELSALASGIPRAVAPWFEFAPQEQPSLQDAGGFDRVIAATSRIPTRRGSHHDLLGALMWLHFPALKTAIHRAQLAGDARVRGPAENAATHLDESGVLVLSSEPALFEALANLRWLDVFWERRAELQRTTRFLAFGHGLLDSLRAPHPRLMGKALFVHVEPALLLLPAPELRVFVDQELAARVLFSRTPAQLQPLPVLGVPGWASQQSPTFYEDSRYFRTARHRDRPPAPTTWLTLG